MITKLSVFVAFVAFSTGAIAQYSRNGVIHGLVLDVETKQPLAGANIVLQGSVLGTASNAEGRFALNNLPGGTYSVRISMVGYERKIFSGIEVREGDVTEVTFDLQPVAIEAEPIIVTASKREQSLEEIPVSVSVLDAKELSYRNTVTIDDALRYVPGVNLTQGQVNIRGSSGYSRGAGARVLLLIDGLPLISGDTGEIIWESVPAYQVDRLEIVKGAGSALYGSSALGGVINVLTKSVGETPETRFRIYGGAYETPKYPQWRWTNETRYFNGVYAGHQQRAGDVGIFVGGSRTADEGYRRNDSWRRYNGTVRLEYTPSPFESLSSLFSVMDQRRGNFFYWKDLQQALVPPDDQLNQQVQSLRWSWGTGFTKYVSNEFYYNVKAGWYHTKWQDNLVSGFDSTGEESRADAVNGEWQATYMLSDIHALVFGVYGKYDIVSADTIFGKHSGTGEAVYVQDEIKLGDRARLTLGGRFDGSSLEGARSVSQFNPKLGTTYRLGTESTVRLAVGRGFRAPSVAEVYTTTETGGITILPNPNLQPERSWSYEAGISQRVENSFLQCSVFQNELWDLIEPTFSPDGRVRFQNVTRARIQGFELQAQTDWLRQTLTTDLGYTYVYPRDVGQQAMLKYRPRHLLYASGRLQLGSFGAGVDFRYISRVERIDDELVAFGVVKQGDERVAIVVTDFRLNLDWMFVGLPVVSSLHVNNAFGYHYVELIGNIAPLRNYVLTLESTF